MIRFHTPFDGKRFVGDKKRRIYHDSVFEVVMPRSRGCSIDGLLPEDVQTFDADSAVGALEQGFSPCPCCLQAERSKEGIDAGR